MNDMEMRQSLCRWCQFAAAFKEIGEEGEEIINLKCTAFDTWQQGIVSHCTNYNMITNPVDKLWVDWDQAKKYRDERDAENARKTGRTREDR